jgi:flagellar biogenesis protein FliO
MVQADVKRSRRKRNALIGIGAILALIGLGVWAVNKQMKDVADSLEDITFV